MAHIEYCPQIDAVYLSFLPFLPPDTNVMVADTRPDDTLEDLLMNEQHNGLVLFDHNRHGQVIGMEVHCASQWWDAHSMVEPAQDGGVIIWFNKHCSCDRHDKLAVSKGHCFSYALKPRVGRWQYVCYIRLQAQQ